MKLSKLSILVVFLLGSVLASKSSFAQAPAVDTLLNNKTYTIELQEDMGKKNKTYPDELMFKGDKMKSKYMTVEEKFKSGKFSATYDAKSTTVRKVNFEATIKEEGGESINYVGTVTGDEIEGTAEWTKKDESTRMMYTFTGTLKVKKVPGSK